MANISNQLNQTAGPSVIIYRVVYKNQQLAKFPSFSVRFFRLLSLLHESRYAEDMRVEGAVRPKNLKKCMKLSWNFQRGGGILEKKIPSVGEVWIFSGTTHW